MICMMPGPVRFLLAGLCMFAVLTASSVRAEGTPAPEVRNSSYFAGQLLVASPRIGDPRFARTVIYMISHDKDGALGLVVNKAYGSGPMEKFLKGFNIDPGQLKGDIRLHYGGPVEPGAGFVLHTADYRGPSTRVVNATMALSTEMSVFKAIVEGHGPRHSLFALGYSGWGPGQLENEIARGDWLSAPADENLIFDDDLKTKWDRASGKAELKL
jgi:putative transcriptional regulator|tara:strand:- start:2568 stop:3209 length:642 start_codon:yes stop_codon:yes gene_type:complete